MRIAPWLPVWACLIATSMQAGVVEFSSTKLGTNLYRLDYILSGIELQIDMPNQQHQQLDVHFDQTLVSSLSNPQVPQGFETMLLQPNNPPGIFGDFIVIPVSAALSQTGPFSVDVLLTGLGPIGPQQFFIDQFDANGNFLFMVEAGLTGDTVPEPSVLALVGMALFAGGTWWCIRRRRLSARASQ